jgi:flagellar hook-associated protein 3
MRVTQNMMTNNAIHWIAKQTERLNDAEIISAAGKKINKLSDDPAAAGQILADRTTISEYAQYISNISQADTWIETGNATLEAVGDLLDSARDIVTEEDAWNSDSAESFLEQMESIYDQVVALANTKFSSTYMYGGNNANTAPFADTVDISGGTSADIVFALAGDASDVTINITDFAGDVVRTLTISMGDRAGGNAIAWDGTDDDGNLLTDGSYDFTVSASDASGDAIAAYSAYRGDAGGKQVRIGDNGICTFHNDGGTLFSDVLKSLSQAITALKNSTYSNEITSGLSDALDDAIKQITAEQVTLANVKSLMTTADIRLVNMTTTLNDEISTIEVGSTETAAVQLSAQETVHETTLKAVSSILKMSKLSDYV